MSVSFLTALVVFATVGLCAGPASAGSAFDAVFGTRHPYEGPWWWWTGMRYYLTKVKPTGNR